MSKLLLIQADFESACYRPVRQGACRARALLHAGGPFAVLLNTMSKLASDCWPGRAAALVRCCAAGRPEAACGLL